MLIRSLAPLALLVAVLATSRPAGAQPWPSGLRAGSRVRLVVPTRGGAPIVARLLAPPGDSLVVRDETTRDTVAVPVAEVTHLEVSGGRHTRVLAGAGMGFLVGGASLALAAAATTPTRCSGECFLTPTRPGAALLGGMVGGVLGAAAGALVGAVWRSERWTPVVIAAGAARLRVAPVAGRGVALSASF